MLLDESCVVAYTWQQNVANMTDGSSNNNVFAWWSSPQFGLWTIEPLELGAEDDLQLLTPQNGKQLALLIGSEQ